MRTFGQIVEHIADAQYTFCSVVLGEKNPGLKIEKTKTSKADLVAALKESFTYCNRAYDGVNDVSATQAVKFMGGEKPKLMVLIVNEVHRTRLRNLFHYMRMKHLAPTASRSSGSRSGSRFPHERRGTMLVTSPLCCFHIGVAIVGCFRAMPCSSARLGLMARAGIVFFVSMICMSRAPPTPVLRDRTRANSCGYPHALSGVPRGYGQRRERDRLSTGRAAVLRTNQRMSWVFRRRVPICGKDVIRRPSFHLQLDRAALRRG